MPDSTIASLHRKYDFKAGFTNSNLSLSLIHFSNLFNTDRYALSNFSTVIFFTFRVPLRNQQKKRHKGGIISKFLDGASLYSFFKSKYKFSLKFAKNIYNYVCFCESKIHQIAGL